MRFVVAVVVLVTAVTILLTTCEATSPPAPAPDFCQLPMEDGDCLAYMPNYYFNPTTNSCIEFIYGGCGGNENRFWTEEECRQTCQR